MIVRGLVRISAATALLAVVAASTGLAGCASGPDAPGVASIGSSAQRDAAPTVDRAGQTQRYTECLREQGVMLDGTTAEGLPQIDKARTPADAVSAALERCREHLPTGGDADRLSAEDIAIRQRHAACIREHGVAEYPDPDPRTGVAPVDNELADRLKNHPQLPAAQQACQSILTEQAGPGVVGG